MANPNDKQDTARVFIALWPEPAVRHLLREWRDAWDWPRSASRVRTERLHITLHFLGNIERERLPQIMDGLQVPFTPFELAFGHAELWPGGIAVLAPDAVPPAFPELHAALGAALLQLGIEPEARKYKPHVTLARRAGGVSTPAQGPAVHWPITGYALMESKMGPDGGYTILRAYPLDALT